MWDNRIHPDGLPFRQRLLAIAAVSATMVMSVLDMAVVNTALPTIGHDLGSTAADAIWVVNSYQIAMLATLIPFAALGDIIGYRLVYMMGLVLFTLTSLACGLAWSLPSAVMARALQGLGAAGIMSVNTALLRFIYPKRILGQGIGNNTLVVAISMTLGPTFASAVLSVASWHWLFLVNVPIGLVSIVVGLQSLPATPRVAGRFDMVSAGLCAVFFAGIVFGIDGVAHGEAPGVIAAECAAAVLSGVVQVWRQRGHEAPMLPVDLYLRARFALSSLTAAMTFTAQGLAFIALPYLLQTAFHRSQVATGFLLTPWSAMVALAAPLAGHLSDRYPAGLLCGGGLIVLAGGIAALALCPHGAGDLTICLYMALAGLGFGFFQSPNLRAIMTSAPERRSGSASGIVATSRLFGQTSGAALVALAIAIAPENGFTLALWMGCGFAVAGSALSLMRLATS